MRRRKPVRGLTLVELVIAIAITAIIIAIALPSFQSLLSRKRLEGVANELISDLRHARAESAQRNEPVRLSVGSSGACYHVLRQTSACDCSTGADACASTRIRRVDLPDDVRLTAGAAVSFDSLRSRIDAVQTPFATATSTRGTWTVNANISLLGRVSACSPQGTLPGFPRCPPA